MIEYLWQLPQNLLGLLGILFFRGRWIDIYNDKRVYLVKGHFTVSLGKYILVSKWCWVYWTEASIEKLIKHEYGHCRQSEYLGPLYLLIVGIPSLTMNLLSRKYYRFAQNYYNRFPENWADKLGKVER